MNPGVYLGMDRAQYDAIPHYNQSILKRWMELSDLPSEFKYWQDHRHEEQLSESLLVGGALDCSLLELSAFDDRYCVVSVDAPKQPTKAQINAKKPSEETVHAIKYWRGFEMVSKGKIRLTWDQMVCVRSMNVSILNNESTSDVFKNCKKAVLSCALFGFDCKVEVDLWEEKTEHEWDLKALKDVSPKGFSKAFFDFGYNIQATFYLSLARALEFDKRVFNFICVKNKEPYTVKVHSFAPFDNPEHQTIFHATVLQIQNAIQELDRRIKANSWEDDQDWRMIDIPAWRLRQAQMGAA